VRCIGFQTYDIVESAGTPWIYAEDDTPTMWGCRFRPGYLSSHCAKKFDRLFPHLKLAEGECCEIEIREVVR
jgi:hypothetical protein